MATGYKNVQMCKTLILPVCGAAEMSIKDYKERYGIDLSEYIYLDEGAIEFDAKGMMVLLQTAQKEFGQTTLDRFHNNVFPVVSTHYKDYDAGSTDAELIIGIYNFDEASVAGLRFFVNKNDDFVLDNVKISGYGF